MNRASAEFGTGNEAFGGGGDLPEEEDLDASQEPGSIGDGSGPGYREGGSGSGGGRVLQGGIIGGTMGGGNGMSNFGARS